PGRDMLAAHPVPEPVRLTGRDDQLPGPRAADVRRDPRQAVVLVRRRQDHLRLRGTHFPSAVGAAGLHGLPDPGRSLPGLWLPATEPPSQTESFRGKPCPPCRGWTSKKPGHHLPGPGPALAASAAGTTPAVSREPTLIPGWRGRHRTSAP